MTAAVGKRKKKAKAEPVKETLNSGIGPVTGRTYFEIAQEQLALERAIAARTPGLDPPTVLKPGEVPRNPANIWNAVDRDLPPAVERGEDC